MPELRKDPFSGAWIIVSPERVLPLRERTATPPLNLPADRCPLCPGNEHLAPLGILVLPPDGQSPTAPWSVRVVPHKYPVLRVEEAWESHGEGIYDLMRGVGAHEIIIETPIHDQAFSELPSAQVIRVLTAYKERIRDLRRDIRLHHVTIYKNHGPEAGGRLPHTYSQLTALPVVPRRTQLEIAAAASFFRHHERCLFCDVIRQERDAGRRLVAANEHFIAFCPFASRFPFETWIIPSGHEAFFEAARPDILHALASLLLDTIQRLQRALNDPPYNFMLCSAPLDFKNPEYYHWRLEIIPRLTGMSGFEIGTGSFINPIPPEEASRFLREVKKGGNTR